MNAKNKNKIAYTIEPKDLAAHLFAVTVTVENPAPEGQLFALPAWIPGSYMIREFARNIVEIRAQSGDRPVALEKIDKDTWQAAPCREPLTLSYDVYAWDLSVRAAHLDQSHGFFNGTSVFLRVIGQEALPHEVDIRRPADAACRDWRVATSMPELKAERHGFGTYVAQDYDELVDHPVEMGDFVLGTFEAHGVLHEVVVTGRVPNLDMARLTADLKKICEAQIALFEPETKQAPIDRYVFLTMAVGDGYGGLEHRASTALLCSRADLPVTHSSEMSEGYSTFLGLCSHEYFHTWHVKRIKPDVFTPYNLQAESYTTLLWLFEGFTTYYDDLMLVRSGVVDLPTYLRRLERIIANVMRAGGRFKQSMAEASFDAWTKYYRQDENAPNALVSYYTKGAMMAMALDLTIQRKTRGEKSLDDVMRVLWRRYGKDYYTPGTPQRGVTEPEVEVLIEEVSGLKLKRFFDQYIRGTEDVPLETILPAFGIAVTDANKRNKPSLDVRVSRGNECRLMHVHNGGAAHKAGLSADDVVIALDGIRVTGSNLDNLLGRYALGDKVTVHAFRRDELMTFELTLEPEQAARIRLSERQNSKVAQKAQEKWLAR